MLEKIRKLGAMQPGIKRLYIELLTVVMIAVLILPIIGTGIARASPSWYDSNWQYRKKITIDSTKVTDNLTNFPVLVNLSFDLDLASDAQNDGDDILFTSANGTRLNHEIERFNGYNGQLVAWINIPALSSTTDTDIYMYYGNASASNQENITATWDANYVAVWHLKEDPSGTAPQMMDSTANNHDGTSQGSWSFSDQMSGLIDGSLDFNQSTDRIHVGTFDVIAGGTGNDGITLEAWFNYNCDPDGRLISKAKKWQDNYHWWALNIEDTGSEYRLRFRLKTNGTTTVLTAPPGYTVPISQWVYAAATYAGSNMLIYQDATQVASTSKTGTISTANNVKVAIGNQPQGAGDINFDGLITEVRVSNVARSPDWIQTSYNNQSSPFTFYSLGAEETQSLMPTVTTSNATLVEETTATLHGFLDNDGGETCQYRFEYGMASGGPYPDNTAWTGAISTGQSFSANVTSLSKGTKYYFRAQAKNSAGTGSGTELNFLTKPDPPSTFTATANGIQVNLIWTKGEGADRTMIRRKTGDYPVDRTDGVQVYFDTGTSVSDTGLSPNTTYYYKAWSEVTGSQQWSDNFAAVTTTTGSGAPPPPPPTAVGGTIFPADKTSILLPWLVLFSILALATAAILIPLRKRA